MRVKRFVVVAVLALSAALTGAAVASGGAGGAVASPAYFYHG
jgi:hypothetical protein